MGGYLQLGGFLAVFLLLLALRGHFRGIDHTLGLILFVLFIAAGIYGLMKVMSKSRRDSKPPSMPTFYGILPRRWQRWVLGEDDKHGR